MLAVDFLTVETICLQRLYVGVLHRTGQSTSASGRMHADAERAVGNATCPTTDVDVGGAL
jgi:hypothetical protein